jgi:hypothetical protein
MAKIITSITGPLTGKRSMSGAGAMAVGDIGPRNKPHTYARDAAPHGTTLTTLVTNLRGNATGIRPAVRKVVRDKAKDTRDTWRRLYKANELHKHAPHYPKSITYDMETRIGPGIGAEIGPDKGKRQGALGNLIEFGSINNWPQMEGARALAIEGPKFVTAVRAVARLDI